MYLFTSTLITIKVQVHKKCSCSLRHKVQVHKKSTSPFQTYRQPWWLGKPFGDLEQWDKKIFIDFLHELAHFKTAPSHQRVFQVTKVAGIYIHIEFLHCFIFIAKFSKFPVCPLVHNVHIWYTTTLINCS